jgi:hypothetical protein
MKCVSQLKRGLVLGLAAVSCAAVWGNSARADGVGYGGSEGTGRPPGLATPGSDASFDKRLPPVLPGEEVSDGKNRMKMWSTSGPVPVAPAPEPWKESVAERNRLLGSGIGVIVDQREGRR